jgi:hypothetical protein
MKLFGLFFFFLLSAAGLVSAQTFTYSKLEESVAVDNGSDGGVGWGSCVTCAGGDPRGTASIASSPFITRPSVDISAAAPTRTGCGGTR